MRHVIPLCDDWYFHKGKTKRSKTPKKAKKGWYAVNLPHIIDDYCGECWYLKNFILNLTEGELAVLRFDGVFSACDVYVNGFCAAHHEGGYAPFIADITPYLKKNGGKIKISLAVRTDSSKNDYIYPQNDAHAIGGIYRNVYIMTLPAAHFSVNPVKTKDLKITPVLNSDGTAAVHVKWNTQIHTEGNFTVQLTLDGKTHEFPAKENETVIRIENPHLWNGVQNPYLYKIKAKLLFDGKLIDRVNDRFGIRSFETDPERGFILNGKVYPLRGVTVTADKLTANETELKQKIKLVTGAGANYVRLAGFQHSPYFYELCDEAGLIVESGIPFISEFLPNEKAKSNILSQLRETVHCNYNHPSIMFWGIAGRIKAENHFKQLEEHLYCLNALCHELDKTRKTVITNSSETDGASPLNRIADCVSYAFKNADEDEINLKIEEFRRENKAISFGICAGLNDSALKAGSLKPFLRSVTVRFSDNEQNAVAACKTFWTEERFVHICSPECEIQNDKINIKIYSNCKNVTVFINGDLFGTIPADRVFNFKNLPLKNGKNTITAYGDNNVHDSVTVMNGELPDEE